MAACQNLLIRFTTASFTSPTADASVCTAKKLISARSSQDKPWGSKKSKKVFGWSALWSTISATSIWRKKLCSLSTTLLAQKCNLCLRYDLSPTSPGRTLRLLLSRRDANPRDPFGPNGFQDRRIQPLCHSSVFNSSVLCELAANLLHFCFRGSS